MINKTHIPPGPVRRLRIDWSDVKHRVDLGMVATNLLGPPRLRSGKRLLWLCPFHDDRNPSLQVDLARNTWRCWACAIGGDAAALVRRVNGCDFPAAVAFLAELSGVIIPLKGENRPSRDPVSKKAPARPPGEPTGLPGAAAAALVAAAAASLWESGGASGLDYLRGRGLSDQTIRHGGLGYTRRVLLPTKAGDRWFPFSGIVIPWTDGARLTRVKLRRIDGGTPKYAEAFAARPLIYPDPAAVRPGQKLIICEGELDCLLLAQQLPEACVITLGSAAARTDPDVFVKLLSAARWFVAHDADRAGDSAAAKFPASAVRVRPPEPCKDWGEVHAGGRNSIRYQWGRHLGLSKTWAELSAQRWGRHRDRDRHEEAEETAASPPCLPTVQGP